MRRLKYASLLLCGIVCILILGNWMIGRKSSSIERWQANEDLLGLQAEKREDREKGRLSLNEGHEELVKGLISLAGQAHSGGSSYHNWHNSKHLAIFALGDLRAADAVGVLVKGIEYYNPSERAGSYLGLEERYPTAEALGKIGMPSVGPTLEKLRSYDEDGVGRRLCCWVINDVLGQKLGRIRLEMAIEETENPAAKKNLREAALAYFKTAEEKAAEREHAGRRRPGPEHAYRFDKKRRADGRAERHAHPERQAPLRAGRLDPAAEVRCPAAKRL